MRKITYNILDYSNEFKNPIVLLNLILKKKMLKCKIDPLTFFKFYFNLLTLFSFVSIL